MGELRGDRDFPGESLLPELGGEVRAQHLQGHRPPVLAVFGQVDGRRSPAAQLPLDRVAVDEGGRQGIQRSGHDTG